MRNLIYIIAILLVFSSCNEKQKNTELNKKIFHYPKKNRFVNDSTLTIIHIDSLKNHSELISEINRVACNKKTPVIRFENSISEFNLISIYLCSELNTVRCYSTRNVIHITKDSIILNDTQESGIDSLKPILKKHILNKKKEDFYSISTEKALIDLFNNPKSDIKTTKSLLLKITTEFNELNKKNGDTLPLKIRLVDYPYIRVWPPLPPPEDLGKNK